MKKTALGLLAAALVAIGATHASAATVTLSDGNSVVTVNDNVLGQDVNPFTGAVTAITSFSNWTITVATGLTKGVNGTATDPREDLSLTAVYTGTAPGTLFVAFGDTGFTYDGPLTLNLSGSVMGSGSFSAEVRGGSDPTGVGTVNTSGYSGGGITLASLAGPGSASFSTSALTSPLSLTEFVTLNANSFSTFSVDANMAAVAVPLPAAAWMGLSTLFGVSTLGYFRKRARSA